MVKYTYNNPIEGVACVRYVRDRSTTLTFFGLVYLKLRDS